MKLVNKNLTKGRLSVHIRIVIFCGFILTCCTHPYCPDDGDSINEFRLKLKPGIEGKDAILMDDKFGKKFGDTSALTFLYEMEDSLIKGNGLIEFDLEQLPSHAKLKRAELKLYIDINDFKSRNIPLSEIFKSDGWSILPIISPWDEHISTPDGPLPYGAMKMMFPANDSSFSCRLDVTTFVKKELESPAFYYGFVIAPPNKQTKYIFNYCSSDHPDSSLHPELIIDYE